MYGVDINSNSGNICRLRLWVELLKHTYYINDEYEHLQTLPTLEFKIISANSLIPLMSGEIGYNESLFNFGVTDVINTELFKLMHNYFKTDKDKKEIQKRFIEFKEKRGARFNKNGDLLLFNNAVNSFNPPLGYAPGASKDHGLS